MKIPTKPEDYIPNSVPDLIWMQKYRPSVRADCSCAGKVDQRSWTNRYRRINHLYRQRSLWEEKDQRLPRWPESQSYNQNRYKELIQNLNIELRFDFLNYEQPVVEPHSLHFRQVPFLTIWLPPQSSQMSPVKPLSLAACSPRINISHGCFKGHLNLSPLACSETALAQSLLVC